MVIKLDMEKGYDKLEWALIEIYLIDFGFNEKWTN